MRCYIECIEKSVNIGKRVRSGSGSFEVEPSKKAKFCKYDGNHRCYWSSCDYVDFKGDVRLCGHHPNPSDRFTPRKAVSVLERGF